MMTFVAAEGGGSQGGADALTGCGGVLGSEAGGRARAFSGPGGAGALKHRSRFTQLSAGDEEELKGTRGGGAKQLTVREGGRGMLIVVQYNKYMSLQERNGSFHISGQGNNGGGIFDRFT